MSNVLVTGVAGFIGRWVAQHLVNAGHIVIGLDDLSGGSKDNIPHKVIFHKGSINNEKLVTKLFEKYKFDYVYHLAAYAAEGLSHFIRQFNYKNNLLGSINLINEAVKHEVKTFIFTSSIAVYGKSQLPMTENMVPQPEDPYGISKYAVELDLRAAHEMFGLNYVIFRPHNVIGPYQNLNDKYRNVAGIFIRQLLQKQDITIFGDGTQTRAFSYIDDVAPYIAQSAFIPEAHQKVFNIGGDIPCSVNELLSMILSCIESKSKIIYLPERKEVKHAYADHLLAKSVFNIKQTTSLHEGVVKMINWAKKQKLNNLKRFKNIEIEKNLPQSWK